MRSLLPFTALLLALLLAGCPAQLRPPLPDAAMPPDLARRPDFAVRLDFAEPEDLAMGRLDLRMVRDLAPLRDLPPRADLAAAKLDFAMSKADLAMRDFATPIDLTGVDFYGYDIASTDLAMRCTVVVNEVQTQGKGGANDEFVELYTQCGAPLDLQGYKLVYRSANIPFDAENRFSDRVGSTSRV